jgi:hypothetical protein
MSGGRVRDHDATVRALTAALGEPLLDPCRDRRLVMRRWPCPACGGGYDDPARIWRPLTIRGEGSLWCDACSASPADVKEALQRADAVDLWMGIALEARDLAERLGGQLVAALEGNEAAVEVEVAAVDASIGGGVS